uniref:Uncharacterized protein n=1 Tax=Oncorhynchus kisutch TaxID=8019 RepID=A0A8C7KI95_ONCKI
MELSNITKVSQCTQRTISSQSPLGKSTDVKMVSDDASLNCAVTVSNGQEEMSPELQCSRSRSFTTPPCMEVFPCNHGSV